MSINQPIHTQPDWYNQRLQDGGPVYTETDLHQYIVEPWNAISSLFIIIPAIYWFIRIKSDLSNYKFLLYCLPLIILGGLGSTLFHTFRAHRLLLIMDVLPTAILTISLTIFFWIKVFRKWWYIFFIVLLSVVLRIVLFSLLKLPDFLAINISYAISGFLIGLPIIILLRSTKFHNYKYVLFTILFFITALFFREMDAWEIFFLPMGTHFLWHAFSGFGTFFLLAYLYSFQLEKSLLLKPARSN